MKRIEEIQQTVVYPTIQAVLSSIQPEPFVRVDLGLDPMNPLRPWAENLCQMVVQVKLWDELAKEEKAEEARRAEEAKAKKAKKAKKKGKKAKKA